MRLDEVSSWGFLSSLFTQQTSLLSLSFVCSARSLFRSFLGSHISAFNCCKSQFRERVSQSIFSLLGYGQFRAYPCVDKESGAVRAGLRLSA